MGYLAYTIMECDLCLHCRWYELCQAARVVSHTVAKRYDIRNTIKREEDEERERLVNLQKQESRVKTRIAIKEKYNKRRHQNES